MVKNAFAAGRISWRGRTWLTAGHRQEELLELLRVLRRKRAVETVAERKPFRSVLRLIAEGHSNKKIASNSTAGVRYAIRNKIINNSKRSAGHQI